MTTPTDHDVFWLARYAYNTLAPLIAEAKSIEPSIRFSLEMRFPNTETHHGDGSIAAYAHWDRDDMFLYTPAQRTKADIDKLADVLRGKVDKLILQDAVAELETV
ncbi:hypothetical protein [uncultured Arthrobacter sp.]|uniref:hypothetical protein n=1 Tax=uncultured Arthrobacter sp. TaxID=114050 RepID=UPI0032165332